jgi:hypothetical protein
MEEILYERERAAIWDFCSWEVGLVSMRTLHMRFILTSKRNNGTTFGFAGPSIGVWDGTFGTLGVVNGKW